MPGRQILLHLVDLLRDDDGANRVLLPVHDALLQRGQRLGPLHLLGIGAKRVHHVDIHRPGNAHVEAGHVGGAADRAGVVGDLAKAVLAPGQNLDPLLAQDLAQRLGRAALGGGGVDLIVILIHVGQREDRHLLHQGRHVDGRGHHEVQRASAHHVGLTHLVAAGQLGVREDAQRHLAIRAFDQQFAEALGALVPGGAVSGVVRQAQRLGQRGAHAHRRHQGRGQCQPSPSHP